MAGLPGAQGPPGFKVRHLLMLLSALHPFCLGTDCSAPEYSADVGTHAPGTVRKRESTVLTWAPMPQGP